MQAPAGESTEAPVARSAGQPAPGTPAILATAGLLASQLAARSASFAGAGDGSKDAKPNDKENVVDADFEDVKEKEEDKEKSA